MYEPWMEKYLTKAFAEHGDFPPPWIYSPNSHPLSMGWRMGDGESYIMVFWTWWKQSNKSFEERVDYFRKWPAPPRWCGWMAETIFDVELWDPEKEIDYSEYFAKLKALGFEGTEKFDEDFNNENYD